MDYTSFCNVLQIYDKVRPEAGIVDLAAEEAAEQKAKK